MDKEANGPLQPPGLNFEWWNSLQKHHSLSRAILNTTQWHRWQTHL